MVRMFRYVKAHDIPLRLHLHGYSELKGRNLARYESPDDSVRDVLSAFTTAQSTVDELVGTQTACHQLYYILVIHGKEFLRLLVLAGRVLVLDSTCNRIPTLVEAWKSKLEMTVSRKRRNI